MSDKQVSESVEKKRLAICAGCPNNKDYTANTVFTFISKFGIPAPEVAKEVCNICKCPIRFRVKKPHMECPDGRWGKAE